MRFILLMMALIGIQPTAYAYNQAKLLDAFFSSVMIRGYKADGGLAYGSGVVVGENKVLTNCHTFRETNQAWVSRGEDSFAIVSMKVNRWHDLCLLQTDNLPVKPVKIGNSHDIKKGHQVVAIGHSSGVPTPLTSNGAVKSLFEMDQGKVIRSTARFALGASGSGLFDDDGRLIGINTFKTGGRNAYFYALPIEWLNELEQRASETQLPIQGHAFWEGIMPETMPFFLQIAGPELKEDWTRLENISQKWILAEPDNSDAWFELGFAREKLGNLAEAEKAYRKSIELDAVNTDALYRVGILASLKGDSAEVEAINLNLNKIDKEIAAAFSKETSCPTSC